MTDAPGASSRLRPEGRFLADEFPRESWSAHAGLGTTARFWLERHRAFRDMDRALAAATAGMREGPDDWDAFRRWLAPSLRHFLSQLHHHHAVEDHHEFRSAVLQPRATRRIAATSALASAGLISTGASG